MPRVSTEVLVDTDEEFRGFGGLTVLMEFVRRCYGMHGIRQAGQMILVWLFLH